MSPYYIYSLTRILKCLHLLFYDFCTIYYEFIKFNIYTTEKRKLEIKHKYEHKKYILEHVILSLYCICTLTRILKCLYFLFYDFYTIF